jgi:hypothetical protein
MANEIIPEGAEQAHALHALVRKRAEWAGRVDRCQSELRAMLRELAHIDGTIGLFNRDVNVGAIKPKRSAPPYAAAYGELSRIIVDALRESDAPLTSPELTQRVLRERGLDAADHELTLTMARRVRACLRHHRVAGTVRSMLLEDGLRGWELVR